MTATGSSGGFMPHGMCFLWNGNLLALHVVSDALIALAYYSIPIILLVFIRRRSDLPFAPIFVMFCLFIVACGTTHVLDIWTVWHPAYWLSGATKALTAAVSVASAILLVRVVPAALALKSPAELAAVNRQLTVSELRYRTLTDTMPQMMGILDATATLSYANQQWRSYTGTVPGNAGSARVERLVHPDDVPVAAALLEPMEAGRDHRVEIRLRRWDAAYRWHAVRIVPIDDEHDATAHWMFTCTDIEEQHADRASLEAVTAQLVANAASERATTTRLRERNRLLSMAEETAHVGHWRFDLSSATLYWSDEVYRTFGLPMTFRPTLEDALAIYHPDDRELVSANVERAITQGAPFALEARVVRPGGEIRDVVSAGQSECDSDNVVVAIFGVLQDVTDSKAAQRRQERLIERFDVATRAAQVGIWDWDVVTNAIVWDPIMFTLYGASDGQFEPTYAAWAAALHPDDRVRAEAELARAAAGHEAFDTEFRVVWFNGDVRHIRAMATLIGDRTEAAKRMIGTNWDITELRLLAGQLRAERDAAAQAATQDALTGLMNRGGLEGWIRSQAELEGKLLCLNIDGFQAVNDLGGHAAGDETLRVVARIIREAVREADGCARVGGDDFLVVLPDVTDMRTAHNVRTRIVAAVGAFRPLGPSNGMRIGMSIGIGHFKGVDGFADALREADIDLYQRKTLRPTLAL